jgi:sugar/nucleoside kinase (ribokinase family)
LESPTAVVLGEALIDLFESDCEGERVYRPIVGGAPLNVAVGLARLGIRVDFGGSVGDDGLGQQIFDFLDTAGVGRRGCVVAPTPTTLAVTSLRDGEPDFRFYGQPPSYALFGPEHLDRDLIAGAGALYCGSLALLTEPTLAAARLAWAGHGPLRTLDPNVRPAAPGRPGQLRSIVEEFAADADLVKLSEPDARALFDLGPEPAARHLRSVGASAVVVTRSGAGAIVAAAGEVFRVPAPAVTVVDTTGAGDATMAGLIGALLTYGVPDDAAGWQARVQFGVTMGSLACQRMGGAAAMPTWAEVAALLGDPEQP